MISESEKDMLNRLPLDEVMRNNGYTFHGKKTENGKRYLMYPCPFHGDKNPSFRVDLEPAPGKQYCGTTCYGCKNPEANTYGAIQLQRALSRVRGESDDYESACIRLAKEFNVCINGKNYNDLWHRQRHNEPVEVTGEIKFNIADRPFTDEELRALGCKVDVYSRYDWDSDMELAVTDGDGRTIKRYSFSPDYYRRGEPAAWDSEVLKRMFNLYPLRQDWEGEDPEHPEHAYISPGRPDKDGKLRSYKIYANRSYPIFVFRYEDENGWWARRYEPYCKPEVDKNGREGANYKFTWWVQGKKDRGRIRSYLYGDNDVMRAMKEYNGRRDVVQTDNTRAPLVERVYMQEVGDNEVEMTRKIFDKIVICSGPRDALSTYFHSNVHVVWPHSETTDIPESTMRRLFAISHSVYVMYDIDETGVRAMNTLGLKYPDLRLLDLPEELSALHDPRTGKPCKDAEQYFNNYNPRKDDELIANVNEHFANMLVDAPCMRFWDTEYGTKREKGNTRKEVDKFTINYSHLMRFLQARGVYNYRDESGDSHYVMVKDNIVEIIDDKEFMTKAKELMKKYLFARREFNSTSLKNAISTQKKVTADSLKEIRSKKLNFKSWGKDFDWFFFSNCAVKVTPDTISAHPYTEIPCHVNQATKLDGGDYRPMEPIFTIVENPEYAKYVKRYEEQMADKRLTPEEKTEIRRDYNNYNKLWRWKLEFAKPIEEMPLPVRFMWDTCRIHWEKEEMGFVLTEEEMQRQKMHFVNKVASLGYLLSRYRTDSMQQMTTFTEYKVKDEKKSSGGTGKTTFRRFIESVRKLRLITGDTFSTAPDKMPLNFQEFQDTVDQVVMIDDLPGDIRGEEFKNLTTNMVVRTLYQNKYTIPSERVPKIFCTMNRTLDMDNPSVYRRCYSSYTSDYYHTGDQSGSISERSPKTKFGKDIIADATPEEYNTIRNLMLQCCQFYLRVQAVILPPMEKDGINRYLYSALEDEVFIEWANEFFRDDRHFGIPVALNEMIISYLNERGDGQVTSKRVTGMKKKFRTWLHLYCANYNIIPNPGVVFMPKRKPADWDSWNEEQKEAFRNSPSSDRSEGMTRTMMWTTKPLGDGYAMDQPRELTLTRGYFFFRKTKDIFKNIWDFDSDRYMQCDMERKSEQAIVAK